MFRYKLRTLLILLAVFSHTLADERKDKWQAYKGKMMAKVGTTVTVSGVFRVGKIADFVETDDGGAIYVMPVKSDDIRKMTELLSRCQDKRIEVSGKLQYSKEVPPPQPGVAAIPEHFFVDIAKATIRSPGVER